MERAGSAFSDVCLPTASPPPPTATFDPASAEVSFLLLLLDFIYFQKEGKGGRKRGRETLMCERYINQLPLTRPQLGTWPATQAFALTGSQTSDLSLGPQASAQCTEPHQPGQELSFLKHHLNCYIFYNSCTTYSFRVKAKLFLQPARH